MFSEIDVDGVLLLFAALWMMLHPEKRKNEKGKESSKENRKTKEQGKPGKKERGRKKGSSKPQSNTTKPPG